MALNGPKEEPSMAEVEPCCPVCGAGVTYVKCKVVCDRCGHLISNCNGD